MAKSGMNIEELSLVELHDLIKTIQSKIDAKNKNLLLEVRRDIKKMIKENGFTIDDIFPSMRKKEGKGNTVDAKYRNPDNFTETWAGRGRKPKWLNTKLDSGSSLEELLIH